MTLAAGLFLIAHGLVHLATWLPAPKDDAPFDPRRSWLVGDSPAVVRPLAITAAGLLVAAGILVLSGAGAGVPIAVAGAGASLTLVLLFHPWFLAAIAINAAIIAVAAV